jgi:hypothetical protein
MAVDLSTVSLEKLKALAYDLHRERSGIDRSLSVLEGEIAKREAAAAQLSPPADQQCQPSQT